jgi:putative transposase
MRKLAVTYAVTNLGRSARKTCLLVGLSRASYNYEPVARDDDALRARMRELAHQRRRFGCPRIHLLLRREGFVVNHKRTERLYREEGLSLRKRKRKKIAAAARVVTPAPGGPNEKWSMDFVTDSLVTGRRFRALAIVDDYSRECLALEVDTSLGGARVVAVLDRLAETRGLPRTITLDNGPEFTGRCLDEWAYRNGVKLNFIRPGKPVENAYIESFIGRFRDECLNENWFISLKDARDIIERWRIDYNEDRPHTSLGGLSPLGYVRANGKILTAVGL